MNVQEEENQFGSTLEVIVRCSDLDKQVVPDDDKERVVNVGENSGEIEPVVQNFFDPLQVIADRVEFRQQRRWKKIILISTVALMIIVLAGFLGSKIKHRNIATFSSTPHFNDTDIKSSSSSSPFPSSFSIIDSSSTTAPSSSTLSSTDSSFIAPSFLSSSSFTVRMSSPSPPAPFQTSCNQKGSSLCNDLGVSTNVNPCKTAYHLYNADFIYQQVTSYTFTDNNDTINVLPVGCTAIFTCDDNSVGMSGAQIIAA